MVFGYSILDMVIWAVVFVIVWKVIEWIIYKFSYGVYYRHNKPPFYKRRAFWIIFIIIIIIYITYTNHYFLGNIQKDLNLKTEQTTKTFTQREWITLDKSYDSLKSVVNKEEYITENCKQGCETKNKEYERYSINDDNINCACLGEVTVYDITYLDQNKTKKESILNKLLGLFGLRFYTEDACQELIPHEITWSGKSIESNWKDGSTIEYIRTFFITDKSPYPGLFGGSACRSGKKQGENVNYFYCEGLWAHKRITSDSGKILSDSDYIINLITEKTNTTKVYRVVEYTCEPIDLNKIHESQTRELVELFRD